MLGFFRRIIRSRFGAIIALLFLGAIAFAFVAGDLQNGATNALTQSSGDAVEVGDASLPATEVQSRVQRVFDANRRERADLTIGQFLSAGGMTEVVGQLVDGLALTEFAKQNGMRVSKKLVDAEIAAIPAFHDATGKFSQQQFADLLKRERILEADLRDDVARQIIQRQIISPAGAGAKTPQGMILPYASMLLEKRAGTVAVLPSLAFLPKEKPSEAAIKAYYATNADRFALPEQRRMRFAVIDTTRFAGQTAPSDTEVAQYFKVHAGKYAASETRTVRQLILPSESAAKALAGKIGPALTLDQAAKQAGLATTTIGPVIRAAFGGQVGEAAMAPVFGAAKGTLVGPVRTGLGWALFVVTDITATPARTLESVRPEIVKALTEEKTRQALTTLSDKIDGQIGDGATFDEVVKSNGLTATDTPPLTREGRLVMAPEKAPDAALTPVVTSGYTMDQGDDPQVIPLVPDQKLALVSLAQVIPAGPPALAQIRLAVERGWAIQQGATKAKIAAEAVRKKVAAGMPLAAALATLGVPLPPPERIGAQRSQLGQQGQQVPEAMVALFSMVKGKSRMLTLPQDQGFAILHLDEILPGNAAGNAQVLNATGEGLVSVLAQEYSRQFQVAIRGAVGVKRNESALTRVESDLRKGGGQQ
ncbi:peptidylprolyl isomerase [soil metagenome]